MSSCRVTVMEGEEWRGKGVERRKVELHFTSKGTLEEFSIRGKHLRTIKLANIKTITVVLSSSRKRNIVLLQLPQEYDLVNSISFIRCMFGRK